MQERATANAMRSAVVVIGSLAFGYLNYHLGFKPFFDQAAQELQNQPPPQISEEPTTMPQDLDDLILR